VSLRERWLGARLDDWAAKGLITGAQADAIRGDLRREEDASRVAPFTVLASLGGLCVALGIILVVAYNWDKIHRGWKLGGFLVLLAAVAEAVARVPASRRVLGAAARLLWLMLPLAGIGLWAQVYQLSGDGFRPLLLWLVLGLPLVWISRDPAVAVVHATGLVLAIFTGTFDGGAAVTLQVASRTLARTWDGTPAMLAGLFGPALAALALLWAYAFVFARRRLGERSRLLVMLSVLVWAWSLFVGDTPFEAHDTPAQFAIVASLAAIYWGVRDWARLEGEGATELGFIGVAAILYFMTFFWHTQGGPRGGLGRVPAGALGLLAASGIACAVRGPGDRRSVSAAARWGLRGLVLLPVALAFVLVVYERYRPVAVAANLGLVALCVWLMAEGVRRAAPGRINLGTMLLGVLILTRFLDYFGTMLQSGMAFIVTGVAFIGVAWALNRGRRELLARAGEVR
jgi:uncharacterized membrane protein